MLTNKKRAVPLDFYKLSEMLVPLTDDLKALGQLKMESFNTSLQPNLFANMKCNGHLRCFNIINGWREV